MGEHFTYWVMKFHGVVSSLLKSTVERIMFKLLGFKCSTTSINGLNVHSNIGIFNIFPTLLHTFFITTSQILACPQLTWCDLPTLSSNAEILCSALMNKFFSNILKKISKLLDFVMEELLIENVPFYPSSSQDFSNPSPYCNHIINRLFKYNLLRSWMVSSPKKSQRLICKKLRNLLLFNLFIKHYPLKGFWTFLSRHWFFVNTLFCIYHSVWVWLNLEISKNLYQGCWD